MALSFSRVASWIDRGRANLRVGYTDITFDDSPTSGVWTVDPDDLSEGISLLFVSDKIYADGVTVQAEVGSSSLYLSGWVADASAVTDELDGEVLRFYWEGY